MHSVLVMNQHKEEHMPVIGMCQKVAVVQTQMVKSQLAYTATTYDLKLERKHHKEHKLLVGRSTLIKEKPMEDPQHNWHKLE